MSDDCDSPLNSKVDGDDLVLYLAYDAASACELHLRVRKAARTNNHLRNDTATLLVSDPLIPTFTPH